MKAGVRITLADNGCGMSAEVQRRIFAPFFTTKADVGTGIGLWITKGLIEKQGGYMRFRSRQGSTPGTVMSFFLPRDRDADAGGDSSPRPHAV
jgi:signal transduction histidine kinase